MTAPDRRRSPIGYRRLRGHSLAGKGAAHAADGRPLGKGGQPGYGRCSCGAMSAWLTYGSQRQQWYEAHRSEIEATEEDRISDQDSATVRVQLSSKQVALIDKSDYPLVREYTWHAERRKSGVWYARSNLVGYMHRLISNAPVGLVVDHINHDGLDNRRSNIRVAPQADNVAHSRRSVGRSGYRGVRRRDSKWAAEVRRNGKTCHLGRFESREEAALAYDRAAIELFGEFAILNFPEQRRNVDDGEVDAGRRLFPAVAEAEADGLALLVQPDSLHGLTAEHLDEIEVFVRATAEAPEGSVA